MKTLLLAILLLSASEAAGANPRLVDALRAYETGVTATSLSLLSRDPVGELSALLDDATVSTTVRKRAAVALAQFDGTYETLTGALASRFPEVRRGAATALVHGYVTRDRTDNRFDLLIALRPLLDDADADVRATCVRSLGRLGSDEARSVLAQHFAHERIGYVRDSIALQLR